MPASSVEILIAKLRHYNDMPKDMADEIDTVAEKAIKELTVKAGDFLHKLDDEKHTEEQVKAVIDAFPESLSIRSYVFLPIQRSWRNSKAVSFVPLMAKEGIRLGVGGERSRGGLVFPNGHASAFLNSSDIPDEKGKDIMDKLRELGLLKKEDIQNFNLLYEFAERLCEKRFEMLATWDPDSLLTTTTCNAGEPLIHDDENTKEVFEMVLKAGMDYFPERLGCLFRKYKGITACEATFDKFGIDETMRIICRCIPPGENHPILHMAAEAAPHLENKLMNYYRDEAFTRDASGRLPSQVKFHAALRKGKKPFSTAASFFINATDGQIEAKDPRSGLYPFMMAASDNRSDLDAVNYLLRRCPKVLVDVKSIGKRNSEVLRDTRSSKRQRQLSSK